MGKIFPSRNQFAGWSLPSKASVVGIPIALIGLVVSVWPRTYHIPAHAISEAVRTSAAAPASASWTGRYEVAPGETIRFDVLRRYDPGPGPGDIRDFMFDTGTPGAVPVSLGRFTDAVGPVYEFEAADGAEGTYTFDFTVGWRGSTSTVQETVSLVVAEGLGSQR